MREIKSPNVTQKRTDNSEKYLIQLIDDGKPTLLDQSVNYLAFITCDGSLVTPAGIELTIQDNQLVLDSAKLDLPAGIYHFEIWAEKDGQRAIYPDSGMKRLVINANATDLPNGTVTSLTLDEFVKEFKNLVKDVGNSSNPNQGGSIEASIDTDKRTITINGKSLTIPEPIDLSGLASKNDLAGLVKQTELAEYVKKNDLPNMPSLTDYVKKEELPKQPDLTKYALKSDLPDLTGYAKMTDIPSITGLVKEAELGEYAKKSELPDLSGYALKSELPVAPDLSNYAKKADIPKTPDLSGYATNESVDEKLKDVSVPSIITTNYGTFIQHDPTTVRVINSTHESGSSAFLLFDNGAELHVKDGNVIAAMGGGWNNNFDHIDSNSSFLRNKIEIYMEGNFPITNGLSYDRTLSYTASSTWINFAGCTVKHPYNDSCKYIWDTAHITGDESKVTPGERDMIKAWYEVGLFSDYEVVTYCHAVKKEG